jgi:competence protein ComEC
MEAEREIGGIALSFAAGTAAAAFSGDFILSHSHIVSSLSLLVIGSGMITLMHPSHHGWHRSGTTTVIAVVMAAAGLVCWICDSMISISQTGLLLERAAQEGGRLMIFTIESIPFEKKETNALITALIAGDRSEIPVYITEAFRSSGASHILALSGLHLGIIYVMIRRCLFPLGNSPEAEKARAVLVILSCGIYTLCTGAGASIVRAFLFILLNETARLTGRHGSTASVLFSALLIQLIIDPGSIESVGFQLSYAAMAGIAFIFPHIKGLWKEDRRKSPMKWIWDSAAMSIACQMTTGPLAYLYFGTFPQYFLLTNLIALPLTGLIIPAALAATLLTGLGICPEILTRATEMLITALTEALDIIASM